MCRDVEGIPKCKNNAYCYPCLSDNDKLAVMNACNDEEWNRGFRCICPPGLAPPFCHRKIGPCDSNRCMNNARCQPASNDTLEYRFDIYIFAITIEMQYLVYFQLHLSKRIQGSIL